MKLGHDLWAFGGIVFDVGQAGPRLRDETTGENLRLMSGVPRAPVDAAHRRRWCIRDSRLRGVHNAVASLIRGLQPQKDALREQIRVREVDAIIRQWQCESRCDGGAAADASGSDAGAAVAAGARL